MSRTIVFTFCVLVFFCIVTEIKSRNVNRTKRSCHKPPKGGAQKFGNGQCQCGISKVRIQGEDSGVRIMKGLPVRPHYKYPWMVGFHVDGFQQVCGAAFISSNFVLTAAHCVANGEPTKRVNDKDCIVEGVQKPCFMEAKKMKIGYLGRSNTMKNFIRVRKAIPHPKYDFSNFDYDLALLQLEKPIKCSGYVRPICLPDGNVPIPKPGSIVRVSGWGNTETGHESDILMETQSVIQTQAECMKAGSAKGGKHLCVKGHPGGTCRGDSGGPLKASVGGKFYIFGVVSHGVSPDCDPSTPQYFSNVKQSIQWIKQNMG